MSKDGLMWDLLVGAESGVARYDGATGESKGFFAAGGDLKRPTGLRFGPDGSLYVSNVGPDNVLRFDGNTGAFLGVAASHEDLKHPRQVAFRDGRLFVSSRGTNRVLCFDIDSQSFIGHFSKVHPSYTRENSSGEDGLNQPFGLIHDPGGNLLVASHGTDSVRRYDGKTGVFIDTFACGNGMVQPRNVIYGPDGNLYVTSGNNRVLRFDGESGSFIDTFVAPESGGLDDPYGLEFGADGNLYVVSRKTKSVLRYDGRTGAFLNSFVSAGLAGQAYVAFVGGLGGAYDPRGWEAILA
jgi:DNA-binding beta-propeller fold protein YncE